MAKGVRAIIIPATQEIYKAVHTTGLYGNLHRCRLRGIHTNVCPCLGGYMGILAENERCVATTNRNFTGRMGHLESEIYLSSPAVAAASALTGRITHPQEVME